MKLREAALAWVNAGFFVFPCAPGGKEPACSGGHYQATQDINQVNAWWRENPDFNIGVVPGLSGMYVLDIDPPYGAASLEALEAEHGKIPRTLEITTPRGGKHYWFTGDVPTSASKLGKKIDTRGRTTGYALVPPSSVNGKQYRITGNHPFADGPEWIAERLSHARLAPSAAAGVDLDLPGSVARATRLLLDYVASGKVANEGEGGDDLTYRVACEVLNLGLSADAAASIMLALWNPHCSPPWEPDEIDQKVLNALSYAQNEQGAWAVAPPDRLFAEAIKNLAPDPAKKPWYWLKNEYEQDNQKPPAWLFPDLLPEQGISMLYGQSGSYKSFIALDMALTLASGIPGYGRGAAKPEDVVYFAAEGPLDTEMRRRPTWKLLHGIEHPVPFYTNSEIPTINRADRIDEFIQGTLARDIHPKMIVIDTVARAMSRAGLKEDTEGAGVLVEAAEYMKRIFKCQVLVIHHSGKDDARGARGSSAFYGGFDTVMETKAHKDAQCVELWVRKQKEAEERRQPLFFQGIKFGNGLAFKAASREEFEAATSVPDILGRDAVGAALREMGAVGEDNAVPAKVLAVQLAASTGLGEDTILKRLVKGSKDKLAGYLTGDKLWFMPAE